MNAKEFLQQAYHIEERIADLKCQLDTLESGMRGQTFQIIGSKSPSLESETEKRAFKAMELRDKISAEIERLYQINIDVFDAISNIKGADEQLVLRYKYIENLTLEKIAAKMGFSLVHISRIHKRAISHLQIKEL